MHNNKYIILFENVNRYRLQLDYHTNDQNQQKKNVILLNHQKTQFFDGFVIIIAVMQLRREPYLLKFKKDNEAAVAEKIKELQMAAEQQKKQVKSLLIEQPPQVPQRNIQVSTSARTNKGRPIQSTKTARKRPKCDDYVDRQPIPSATDTYNNAEEQQPRPPLPLIVIPGKEAKEEDKEFEYLKSEEYKKYLERLTQGHSKEEKAKIIKQNRNNNVYLGKTGMMDRKQYIQEIIRTKEVLPRVNLQYLQKQQNQQQNWRGQFVDSLVFNENPQPKSIKKPVLENNKRQMLQESPIRFAQQQFSVASNRQKQSNNVTIILSPVCQNHERQKQQKQYKQLKQQKQLKYQKQQQQRQQKQYKELKQNQQYKDHHQQKQIPFISYHNQKTNIKPKPKSAKQAELSKPNIILHQQKSKPLQTKTIKCETYRKQFEYCQKMNYHATQRDNKRQKSKNQKKYSCKFMIDQKNKKSYEPKRTSQQSSLCSSPSFHKKKQTQNYIYDISFKIDKPSSKKQTYYQPLKKENPNIYSLNSFSPSPNYHKTPEKPVIIKHTQPRQRLLTEISNNYYPLQFSQTNSAITRQDTSNHSRSPHKISVISRSKHRK